MTSPLAQFENARILWVKPGTRSSGRDGFKTQPGQAYLIMAFLKRRATSEMMSVRLGIPAAGGQPYEFKGYTLRWAELPADQVDTYQTADLTALTWDDTALLPDGADRDQRAKLFMAGQGEIEIRFTDMDGSYGQGGIGTIIRDVLGDPLYLVGGQVW